MLITISRKKRSILKQAGEIAYIGTSDFPLKVCIKFHRSKQKVYYLKFLNKNEFNTTKIKAARCQISSICHHFKILFQLWL